MISIWELYKKRVNFPHPVGIIIGKNVKIGSDCTIFQNVTIGTKDKEGYLFAKYPKIENNVTIYANSVIIGDITIGESAIIGAGAVVLEDIPPFNIAVGNPARILKKD